MALADPIVIEAPSIIIDGVEFECASRTVNLIPKDKMADVATFCNPGGERPGSTTWTMDVEILLSFGATPDGTWTKLHAMRKQKKTIVVKPDQGAVAPTNPSATFSGYIPSIPFMQGKIGESMPFTLTVVAIGDPVFATT